MACIFLCQIELDQKSPKPKACISSFTYVSCEQRLRHRFLSDRHASKQNYIYSCAACAHFCNVKHDFHNVGLMSRLHKLYLSFGENQFHSMGFDIYLIDL
jgi:hypothetical protein